MLNTSLDKVLNTQDKGAGDEAAGHVLFPDKPFYRFRDHKLIHEHGRKIDGDHAGDE